MASDVDWLRPFVPAQDYGKSVAFYRALGFTHSYQDETVTIFELGPASFILQNFYVEAFAANCMLQLMVHDLQAWWARLDALSLTQRFAVRPPIAPAMQPWGLEVGYLFDPSGVLWHVAGRPLARRTG